MTESQNKSVWDQNQNRNPTSAILHLVTTAVLGGIGIVAGTFGSLAIPIGVVSVFWPGQAVQSVGCVWFGYWGAIASTFFPLISNLLSGVAPLPVSLALIPANFMQGMSAGWAFRFFKADPSLRNTKDWVLWIIGGAIIPNIIGAGYGTWILQEFKVIPEQAYTATFLGWVIGNIIPTVLIGSIILKSVSPIVVRSRSFVRGYWN
jgi:integral membrane sensor domain MASE1